MKVFSEFDAISRDDDLWELMFRVLVCAKRHLGTRSASRLGNN